MAKSGNGNGRTRMLSTACVAFVMGLLSTRFLAPERATNVKIDGLATLIAQRIDGLDTRLTKVEADVEGIRAVSHNQLADILAAVQLLQPPEKVP